MILDKPVEHEQTGSVYASAWNRDQIAPERLSVVDNVTNCMTTHLLITRVEIGPGCSILRFQRGPKFDDAVHFFPAVNRTKAQ